MLFKYNNVLKILDCSKSKMSNYLRYDKISDTMIENEELNLSLSLSRKNQYDLNILWLQ